MARGGQPPDSSGGQLGVWLSGDSGWKPAAQAPGRADPVSSSVLRLAMTAEPSVGDALEDLAAGLEAVVDDGELHDALSGPRPVVVVDPALGDVVDGRRVQVVQLLPARRRVATRPAASKTSRCLETDCRVMPMPEQSYGEGRSPLCWSEPVQAAGAGSGSPSALNTASMSRIGWSAGRDHATIRLHDPLEQPRGYVSRADTQNATRAGLVGAAAREARARRAPPRPS